MAVGTGRSRGSCCSLVILPFVRRYLGWVDVRWSGDGKAFFSDCEGLDKL